MGFDDAEHDLEVLRKSLKAVAAQADFPITFGGLVGPDGAPLSSFYGTHGQTLHGLLIEPSQGLGGRAIAERRPVAATQYRNSTAITHRYDREVLAENIVCLLAVPVVVDGEVRAVMYGAHRVATQLGDPTVRATMKVAKALAWEYSVNDEVRRRIAVLQTEGSPGDRVALAPEERLELRELYAELREVSRAIDDDGLSKTIDRIGRSLRPRSGSREPGSSLQHAVELAPRELDVLANVALGKRNAHIALQLDLAESTVKSYLSSAMRKLGTTNRYQAVIAARRIGLIP